MALTKIKKCQMCLSLFNATRKDAKTCSASCRKRLHRALQTRVKERAVTVERKISEDLHRLAGSFTKNFVAFEPLLLSDEEGAIPVRVERRPPGSPITTGGSDGPGNVFHPSSSQTDTLQGDSLPVVEVPSATAGSIPADKTKPINLFRTKDRGENIIPGQNRRNPYTSGNRVKKVFSELGNVRRRSWGVIAAVVLLLLVSGVFFNRDSDNRQISSSSADDGITASTDELGDLFSRDGYKLSINVPLDVRKTLIITPGEQPAQLEKGQIFFDQSADALFYYDGEQLHPLGGSSTFVNNTIQGPTNITNSIVTNSTILNSIVQSGVTSVTGTGNQIIVSSNTGDVVLSLPQAIATTSTPTFSGLNLASALQVGSGGTGGTNFTANTVLLGNGSGAFQTTNAGSSGQCLVVDGSGVPTFQSCPGSGGVTAGGSQTPGRLTKFDTIANQIVDSIVGELAGTVTVNGDLSVTGTVSGNGSGLTNVNAAQLGGQNSAYYTDASNISSGTLNDARLSGNVALYNAVTANFTGALQQGGDDVCTISGNCAGVGGVGDITGNGTVNRIAMFDAAKNIINSTLLQGTGSLTLDSGNDFILAGGNLSVTGQSFVDYTLNTACSGCTAFGVSFTNNDGPGGSNYQSIATFGNEEGSGNTEGILDLYNNDADNTVGAAIIINNYGAGFANIINNQGVLISGAELNLLDGHDAALIDTNDAVTTAITGVGALTTGSIGPGFGPIDTGSDPISTTGTITAGTLSINSESFTDLTGTGLTNIGGVLTVDNSVLDNNFFIQGGNSFGAAAIFGTNDNQNIQFETNGSTVATLTTAGQLQLAASGNTGGLLIGGDTSLYRAAAGVLQSEGEFRVIASGSPNDYLSLSTSSQVGGLTKVRTSGGVIIDLQPEPLDGTSGATVRLFRDTNTTGAVNLDVLVGNGTSSVNHRLTGNSDSYFAINNGNVGIGVAAGTALTGKLQFATSTTAAGGIVFGTGVDSANLYRSAADILRTDDNFVIGSDLDIQGGDLNTSQTTFNLLAGATTAINIGPSSTTAVNINLAGGSGDTGCTVAGGTGNLTCSGAITTTATSGSQGWWSRSSTTLQPSNSGDNIATSGNLQLTGNAGTNTSGILFGASADVNLYRYLAGVLVTDGEMNARSYQCAQYETANQVCVGATAPATPGAGIAFGSANDTNLYRAGTGSLKTDGQFTVGNNGGGQLNINNGNESVAQTDFTQSLNKSGINIITDFTDGSYTPGLFWSTQNNNSTRPKAGIYMFQDNANGTSLMFGTSGNYATGLTNTALELGSLGNAKFKNGTDSATGFQIQNSSGAGLLTVNTTTGATLTSSLFIDSLGSGGTTALCWNGSSQVSSCASTGSIGFWNRTGTVLQPSTAGDSVNIRSTSNDAFLVEDASGNNVFSVETDDPYAILKLGGTGKTHAEIRFHEGSTDTWSIGTDDSGLGGVNGFYVYDRVNSDYVFGLDSNGAATFRNGTNSAAAFRVQDATGTGNLFTVDTQNYLSNFVDSNVGIGATGNGADKLFVQSASDTVIAANSTGSNDILQLRDNGANVFTVSDTGEILSRNSADSAVALQIQNSTNDPVLTVSTTGGNYFGGVGDLQLHDQATISFGANSVTGEDINGDFHLDVYNGGLIQMSTDDAFRVQDNSGSIVVNVDTTGSGTALYVQQNDTGDLIEVTRQTDTAFLIDNGGNVLFKPVTGGDSATAFRIQNAGGQNLFVADTGNQRIAIGPASVPGNGVLTIGTNTTTASGGIYLGTDTNLYRDDSNSLRTDGDFVVGDDVEVLGDTVDIRRTSLAKENALRFTTTTGVDWKMYQSTADSNFRLWNDHANQDVLMVDGDGETRIDANSSDVLVLNNTTASGTHVYQQYELDGAELWEAGVDDTNEYFLYNDVDGQLGFTLDNQGSLLRFDNSATEALTGERYDGTEFFDFQIVDHGGEDYGQLQLGEGLPSSEILFTNDGSDRWAIGTDDSGDGNDSLYIYNYTMADYNLTIDSTGAVDINGDLEVDFSGGTSSTNGVCHTGADIDGTSSGTDRRIVPCNNSAGDIAEWYEVRGQAEAGDLLVVTDEPFTYQSTIQDPYTGITQEHKESKTISKLERSAAPYQSTIFGVISTSPVQTYGADVKYQGDNPQPIALKGRVPVKVTTENGAIRPGDKLTASSKPGYAMKATQPGYVIGTAISGLDSGEGRVEVFVDMGWDGAVQTGQTLSAASTASNQYSILQLVSIVAGTFIFMQLLVVFSRIGRGKMIFPKIRHT